MFNVRFSIVIPTKNRARTLESTLRTCLAQQFESYEIVVSDNCSSPETKAVVAQFASPRIRYIRSNEPLAQGDSWELAVSHAKGEYVTLLGDDDGLLLHALQHADKLLRELKAPLLHWKYVLYGWPDSPGIFTAPPNIIGVPLLYPDQIVDARQVALRVVHGFEYHSSLPMIYNSFVHQSLLSEIRKRAGRVFVNFAPDVHSGFCLSFLLGKFYSSGIPLSICGISASSLGGAVNSGDNANAVYREEAALTPKGPNFVLNRSLPFFARSNSSTLSQSFEGARRVLFPHASKWRADRKLQMEAIISDIINASALKAGEWEQMVNVISEAVADDKRLRDWATKRLAAAKPPRVGEPDKMAMRLGLHGNLLNLDGSEFYINNVHDVSEFFEKLFRRCGQKVSWGGEKLCDGASGWIKSKAKSTAKNWVPPSIWKFGQRLKAKAKI